MILKIKLLLKKFESKMTIFSRKKIPKFIVN